MNGQISLFDFLEFAPGSAEKPAAKKKVNRPLSVVNYLEKGERIETLAREKFQRIYGKDWDVSELEQKIYTAVYEKPYIGYGCIQDLAPVAKAFRSVLRRIDLNNPEDENLKGLKGLFSRRYNIEFAPSTYLAEQCYGKIAGEPVMSITVRDGNKAVRVNGLLQHSHPKKKLMVKYRGAYQYIGDLAYYLSYLFVLMTVEQRLKEVKNDPEAIFWHKNKGLLKGDYDTVFEPYYKKKVLYYLDGTFSAEEEELVNKWFPMAEKKDKAYYNSLSYGDRRLYCRLDKNDLEWAKARMSISFSFENGHIYYFDQVTEDKEKSNEPDVVWYRPIPSSYYMQGWQWLYLFLDIVEEKGAEIRNWQYLKSLQGHVATACQTKKNIPEKTLKAMEESEFNNYFGYVEYDEDVDIEKASEVAKEFIAIKETYFPGVNASENALRLRKLGKHRALGLYYPFVQCLCVDINSPSSFIHEFGHLIDYTYGRLSQKFNFYEIRKRYEELVDQAMGDNDQYKGNTKYNREYFLNPTEIFARSFEIYASRCLGIKNSLLETPGGYEAACYPSDEGYVEMIRKYFDQLFATINAGSKDESSESVA